MSERLPEDTQTLYAELLTLLLASQADRGWSHLTGTFTTKTVAGRDYVYFQYSDPGGSKRQFAIGASTPAVDRIIASYQAERGNLESEEVQLERLASLLRVAGLAKVPQPVGRVLRALADAGLFRLGGVLVGSYAFAVIGNALGLRWTEAAWRTHDIDVAGHLEIATPNLQADVPRALESLQMGFVPVPQLDPRHASTSFKVRGQTLRVDLVTPGSDRQEAPVYIPRFNAAAAPIKHLGLLMADPQPAAAIDGTAVLVMIPQPGRYALHKLLVSRSRALSQQTKSIKDLHQAALLLAALGEDRPEDLERATHAFAAAGPSVMSKVHRGLDAAAKQHPECGRGADVVRRVAPG